MSSSSADALSRSSSGAVIGMGFAMVETGLASSVSDAGVGVLCARAALRGAFLNVKINVTGLDDEEFVGVRTGGKAVVSLKGKLRIRA